MALLFGFRVMAVRVGPIGFKRWESAQWAFNQGNWTNGFVQAQFRKIPGPWAAPRFCAFLLGGSTANIGTAFLLAPFSSGESLVGRACGYLMLACILIGLCNLIPAKSKLGATDGAKILLVVFSRKRREDFIFRLSLLAHIIEIRALARDRNFQNAINKIDEFASRYSKLSNLKPDAAQHLSKMREALEKAVTEASTANSTTQAAED